ncbi:unnamed protein product [Ambrosiozyma monospora]|uniref:Unnamed protein product n=1 Tax=Ambrosiozyma monospora TaxID=43982 RepID=A0ACB5TA51_AMBMO|nr:unnamed protein product [Ambrosiozyma monospora]
MSSSNIPQARLHQDHQQHLLQHSQQQQQPSQQQQLTAMDTSPNSSSNSSFSTNFLRKKQQQYPTTTATSSSSAYRPLEYSSIDIINLDSDADDYAFKDDFDEIDLVQDQDDSGDTSGLVIKRSSNTGAHHRLHHMNTTNMGFAHDNDDFSCFETAIQEDDDEDDFGYNKGLSNLGFANNNNLGLLDDETRSCSKFTLLVI